jgi:hypothetical protein
LAAAAKLLEKGAAHVVKSEENKKAHHVSEWGNALINGGANLGSAAISNHQQNQQLQQQQQLQQRNFFALDSRYFDELEAREPRRPSGGAGKKKGGSKGGHKSGSHGGSKGGSKGGKGGKGGKPPANNVKSREEEEFWTRRFVFPLLCRLDCINISLHLSPVSTAISTISKTSSYNNGSSSNCNKEAFSSWTAVTSMSSRHVNLVVQAVVPAKKRVVARAAIRVVAMVVAVRVARVAARAAVRVHHRPTMLRVVRRKNSGLAGLFFQSCVVLAVLTSPFTSFYGDFDELD